MTTLQLSTMAEDARERNCEESNDPSPFGSNLSLEDMYIYYVLYATNIIMISEILSRQMQAKFAAERNWGKFHTPRNLLLAMVSSMY